jgi:hypothetical protein
MFSLETYSISVRRRPAMLERRLGLPGIDFKNLFRPKNFSDEFSSSIFKRISAKNQQIYIHLIMIDLGV